MSLASPCPGHRLRQSCAALAMSMAMSLAMSLAIALAIASSASAACSSNFPPANSTVVCTGTDTTGVHGGGSNIHVTVDAGAQVLTTQSSIVSLSNGANVVNNGTVASTQGWAVLILQGDVTNRGLLQAGGQTTYNAPTVPQNFAASVSTGSILNGPAGRIVVDGIYPAGLYVRSGSVINQGSISVTGDGTSGLLAGGISASFAFNSGTITTAGPSIHGMVGRGTAGARLSNQFSGSITTSGVGSIGIDGVSAINVAGGFGTILQAGSIVTTGAAAHGVQAQTLVSSGYNAVTVSGLISVTGAGAAGVNLLSDAGTAVSLVNTATGIVSSAQSNAIQGGAGNETVTSLGTLVGNVALAGGDDGAFIAGNAAGVGLFDGGAGTDALTLSGLTRTGGADLQQWESLSLADTRLTLSGSLVMGNGGIGIGTVAIDSASTIDATAAGPGLAIAGSLANAGLVTLADGAAGQTLAVTGDYAGQGGTVRLDAAPAGAAADRLAVAGATSGTTLLDIAIAAGQGGATQGDGLVLISVGGASLGTFSLAHKVIAGAFAYGLYQGGTAASGDWYLRSVVRPVVYGAAALPLLARSYDLEVLGSLRDRGIETGDGGSGINPPDVPDATGSIGALADAPLRGTWARVFGQAYRERVTAGGTALDLDGSLGFTQFGTALFASERAGLGRVELGLYGAVGETSADAGTGTALHLDGYTGGAYATVSAESGLTLDAVGQLTRFLGHVSATGDAGGRTEGWASTASLEGGYSVRLDPATTIEPRGRVAWHHAQFGGYEDAFGDVSFEADDNVSGWAGARIAHTWMTGRGAVLLPVTLSLTADLHASTGGGGGVDFDGEAVGTGGNAGGIELGAGVNAALLRNVALYGKGTVAFGEGNSRAVSGTAGLRLVW